MFLALNLVLTKKQRFGKDINGKKDQIDLKDFDAKLLKTDKKEYNEIDIYYIGYVTIKILLMVIILIV